MIKFEIAGKLLNTKYNHRSHLNDFNSESISPYSSDNEINNYGCKSSDYDNSIYNENEYSVDEHSVEEYETSNDSDDNLHSSVVNSSTVTKDILYNRLSERNIYTISIYTNDNDLYPILYMDRDYIKALYPKGNNSKVSQVSQVNSIIDEQLGLFYILPKIHIIINDKIININYSLDLLFDLLLYIYIKFNFLKRIDLNTSLYVPYSVLKTLKCFHLIYPTIKPNIDEDQEYSFFYRSDQNMDELIMMDESFQKNNMNDNFTTEDDDDDDDDNLNDHFTSNTNKDYYQVLKNHDDNLWLINIKSIEFFPNANIVEIFINIVREDEGYDSLHNE